MDAEPLVSIVLPSHNRERYLREAVESVLRQTYRHWELVVVDDGSTDGTAAYLSGLADARLRVVSRRSCGGAARARNEGLRAASGSHVAFLDSDDLWMPGKLRRQITDLLAKRGCRWSYTYFQRIDGEGCEIRLPPGKRRHASQGWIFEDLLRVVAWVATPTVIAERGFLEEAGGFDERLEYCEDFDLWIRLARRSPVALVPEPLAAVRVHDGNRGRANEAVVRASWVRVYDRLLGDSTLGAMRRVCRREWVRASAYLADRLRSEGRYRAATSALRGVVPYGLVLPHWWVSLAKTLLRPLLPAPVLRAYRSWRGPRHPETA